MNLAAAEGLARQLMNEHGLSHWTFAFDRAERRFGLCSWTHKRITLSAKLTLLNDIEPVRETILHEIAHALAPGDGHGPIWRAMCRKLGIPAERCFTEKDVVLPARKPSRYEVGCLRCGWWQRRSRLPSHGRLVCRRCHEGVVFREAGGMPFRIVTRRDRQGGAA